MTTVEIQTISLQSAPSLVMRKSARRLAKSVLKPRLTMKEVEVVAEAVDAVLVVEVEQVAETRGNVLLGIIKRI